MSTSTSPSSSTLTFLAIDPQTRILIAKLLGLFGSGVITGTILTFSTYVTPALLLPSTSHHPLPARTIQAQWQHIYTSGKRTMPFLALFTSTAYFYLSLHHRLPLTTTSSWFTNLLGRGGGGKQAWYAWAGMLTVGIVPYTMLFMRRNIDGLEKAGRRFRGEDTASITTTTTEEPSTTMPTITVSEHTEERQDDDKAQDSPENVEDEIDKKQLKQQVSALEDAKRMDVSVRKLVDDWATWNLGRAVLTGTGFVMGLWATLT